MTEFPLWVACTHQSGEARDGRVLLRAQCSLIPLQMRNDREYE